MLIQGAAAPCIPAMVHHDIRLWSFLQFYPNKCAESSIRFLNYGFNFIIHLFWRSHLANEGDLFDAEELVKDSREASEESPEVNGLEKNLR